MSRFFIFIFFLQSELRVSLLCVISCSNLDVSCKCVNTPPALLAAVFAFKDIILGLDKMKYHFNSSIMCHFVQFRGQTNADYVLMALLPA